MSVNTFDAIIIGAGSVGNPTALFLAEEGLRVLAIDKNSSAGMGENKAAIGGVRATHSDPAKIHTASHSLHFFSTWREKYGTDIGWKTGGYCYPVYGKSLEQTLKGYLPIQKKYGLNISWLGPDDIQNVIPGVNPTGLIGGTYAPDDGQVSPLLMAANVQKEASRLGVTYRFNEIVTEYIVKSGKIIGVITDKGKYFSDNIVITTGANARYHGKLLGIDLQVFPESHEAGISAPIKPFLKPLVVDMRPGPEGRTANFYFGQADTGQIIFCYTPKDIFPGYNRENLSEFMPTLASRLVSLIPKFENLIIRRTWRGLYPMTPDGMPIVDSVDEIDGAYVGVGMCGQGFMLGPGVGLNLASKIINGVWLIRDEYQSTFSLKRNFDGSSSEVFK